MAKSATTTRKTKPAAKKAVAKKAVAEKAVAKKAAPAEKVTAKKTTNGSTKKYETMIVASVVPENPRRAGTKAAKLFDAMTAYVKSHRNVNVAELIAETEYRVQDFKWDLQRGFVTIKEGTQ